jgi:hypothetical protein
MTVKNVAPRCPDGQHELYNVARPNRRVTKCRRCRASVRIPATPAIPGHDTVPAGIITEAAPAAITRADGQSWTGTCTECGQTWESDQGAVTYCPECDVIWQCGECDGTRILSRLADSGLMPTCELCGWQEEQTLGELLTGN